MVVGVVSILRVERAGRAEIVVGVGCIVGFGPLTIELRPVGDAHVEPITSVPHDPRRLKENSEAGSNMS
jgi:hypothetical protein